MYISLNVSFVKSPLACWKLICLLFHVRLCYAYPCRHVNMKSTLTQRGLVLTQGKFPIYKDSFLSEFPAFLLFSIVDFAFSWADASFGGATFVVTFLSWLTAPVRTASKSSFASAILSNSCEGQKKATQALYTITPWVSDVCRASMNKTHCQGKCKYKQMQQQETVWNERGLFPFFLKMPKYYK